MGAWLDRLAARRAHGNTAKTAETPAPARVSAVLAVSARVSAPTIATTPADPFLRWRLANAARLTADTQARGYDSDG